MRYHFGYSVGHIYGHTTRQPAASPVGEHDETPTHQDPMAPPASHALNTPALINRPVSPVSQHNALLEQVRRDPAQEVGLEGESSSESNDSLDLDDEEEDEDQSNDSLDLDDEEEDEGEDESQDGAEVGEDVDFRNFDDAEELFAEEMYA